MKKIMVLAALILVSIFSAHSLIAQEGRGQARLRGVVVDMEGNPVEGATVELESLMHKLSMTTKTDKRGVWTFLGLGKTVAKITITKEGYEPTVIPNLQISAIKNPDQEVVLYPIRDVSRVNEADPRSIYLKGETFYNEGEYEKAIEMFKLFIEKLPDLYEARINLGNCYIRLKEYDKAIEEFEYVLDRLQKDHKDLQGNKTAASIYASLGELFMDQGKREEAKEYFEKSINIDPSNQILAYNVGELLFNSGRIDEAISYYKISIDIDPKWSRSYLKLGYCYLNKAEFKTALDYFKKFIELSPEDDPQVDAAKEIIKQLEKM